MVWLLPVLDEIRNFLLNVSGNGIEGLGHDTGGSPVRSHSEGNGAASGMSIQLDHTQVENGDTATGSFFLRMSFPPLRAFHRSFQYP